MDAVRTHGEVATRLESSVEADHDFGVGLLEARAPRPHPDPLGPHGIEDEAL